MDNETIRRIAELVFTVPSAEELDHDYLWRYARRLPGRGEIGIFNRSHYEEVLAVKIHGEYLRRQKLPAVPEPGSGPASQQLFARRYHEINEWERYLNANGFRIVKLLLNLSKEEQRCRFLQRIDQPAKNWRFSAADVWERRYWHDYQDAFSDMLSNTSTSWAPWYVIPADHKWFARIASAAVLVNALAELDPGYPVLDDAARRDLLTARSELEQEAPRHGRPR